MENKMADAGMPWHLHLQLSQDLRKGYAVMRGALVPVAYQVVDGQAIFEGDIVLGAVADVDWLTDQVAKGAKSKELTARLGSGLWPKATVPYVIESAPKAHLIAEATRIWSEQTAIKFIASEFLGGATSGVALDPWPLVFVDGKVCSSHIGYQNRRQKVTVGAGCDLARVLHETGHAIGLFNEHTRPDRDDYIEVLHENIEEGMEFNFAINSAADTARPYDYASIMHCGGFIFSKNGKPTLRAKKPGVSLDYSVKKTISPGDIAAVNALYGAGR
jgi:astacin